MSTFEHLSQSQNPGKPSFLQKMRHFWLKYGEKVILAVAIVLIALFSFEAGFLKGQKNPACLRAMPKRRKQHYRRKSESRAK